jgi:hypothetical protein
MQYFRIYTGPDGETHFEDVELSTAEERGESVLSAPIQAASVIFRRTSKDQNADWHPAPRRQFVVTLSGEAEIVASDGEVRRVGPGSIMLAEDLTGKGHITRGVGNVDRLSLFITFPE